MILQSLTQVYLKFDSVLLNLINAEDRKDEEGKKMKGQWQGRETSIRTMAMMTDDEALSYILQCKELFAFPNDRCVGSSSPPRSYPSGVPALYRHSCGPHYRKPPSH